MGGGEEPRHPQGAPEAMDQGPPGGPTVFATAQEMAASLQALPDRIKRYKLVVVGDGACGKTSLLTMFKTGQFPEDHIPTIFNNDVAYFVFTPTTGGQSEEQELIELSLWDTAGQEHYERLRPLSYTSSDVILICFSIDNHDSFKNVKDHWFHEIKHYCRGVPIVLVANKIDLRHDAETIECLASYNQVPLEMSDLASLASSIGAFDYAECSSKCNQGVTQVFVKAAEAAMRRKKTGIHNISRPWFCTLL